MLLGGIVLGLALGLLNGGRLENITLVRLRWPALIFLAVLLRYGADALWAVQHPHISWDQ